MPQRSRRYCEIESLAPATLRQWPRVRPQLAEVGLPAFFKEACAGERASHRGPDLPREDRASLPRPTLT